MNLQEQISRMRSMMGLLIENTNCQDVGKNLKQDQFLYHGRGGIPYNYTFKNPFNDGFDYQYKTWDNCQRTWIRRSVENRNINPDDPNNFSFGWDADTGYIDSNNNKKLWTDLDKLVKKKIDEYSKRSKVVQTAKNLGNNYTPNITFKYNIKTKEEGDAFRSWVNSDANLLNYATNSLKTKKLEPKFGKSGSHTNDYIKIVWDTQYGDMTIGDWYVAKVLSKINSNEIIVNNRLMLKENGFPDLEIKEWEKKAKSANHFTSMVVLKAIKTLTDLISAKSRTGTNGYVEIKILDKNPTNAYYLGHKGSTFSSSLGKYLMSQKICSRFGKNNEIPAPYGCWLYDFYYDYNKIESIVNKKYESDPDAVNIPGLFPNGILNFFSTYFGTSNYQTAMNGYKTYTSKMCTGVQTIDPELLKGLQTSNLDKLKDLASELGLTYDNLLAAVEFSLAFMPGFGPAIYGTIQAGKAVKSFSEGKKLEGLLYTIAAIAPFAKGSKVYKLDKNLSYPIKTDNLLFKMSQKAGMKNVKSSMLGDLEKKALIASIPKLKALKDAAESNIEELKKIQFETGTLGNKKEEYKKVIQGIENREIDMEEALNNPDIIKAFLANVKR